MQSDDDDEFHAVRQALYCVGSMRPVNGGYANDGGVNDGRTTAGNQTIWIENVTIGFIVMNTILWIHGTDRRRGTPNLNQLN
jgi:hypothetical protein